MKFKRLKIKNIRSYQNTEIIFPDHSVLLSGDIGSGKTTILLAIEFALFGLQPGQKGSSILRTDSDNGEVELEFELEGNTVIITRLLKRKKTVTQESTSISINGDRKEKSITEIKNQILSLINYPQEFAKKTNILYKFTVYTPQEQMKQIILEHPETRLNTLRHIFGIDKYKRIKENSQILITKLRENSRLKQGQILDLEQIRENLNEKRILLNQLQNQYSKLSEQIVNSNKQLLEKEKSINELKEKIEEKQRIENEIEKTNILLTTKTEQSFKINQELEQSTKKISEAKKSFDQFEFDKLLAELKETKFKKENQEKQSIEFSIKLESFNSKIRDLKNLIEQISNLKTCPTCLQQVSLSHKNHILDQTEKEISKTEKEKSINEEKILNLKNSLSNLTKNLSNLDDKKQHFESLKFRLQVLEEETNKISSLKKQKTSLKKDIQLLNEQVIRLKQAVIFLKKFENIHILNKTQHLELTQKHRAFELQKAQTEKELEISKIGIETLNLQIIEKQKVKSELNHVNELIDWIEKKFIVTMSLIEKSVMSRLRIEFSRLFSQWFSILVPDTFAVHLDEEFTPIIEQQNFQLDYAFLSGGERTAIALAYRLALNKTINSLLSEIKTRGIVILDEPTDGFSQAQLDKMRDVFSQLDADQLIIVSHDQKIESFVDSVIKLKKVDGVSKIV
ncbi:MAG: AAA family ATPase [Nanoarchaeota archaeon]|nr:AAA family ATPase [Nanoarchaeota archaeon]